MRFMRGRLWTVALVFVSGAVWGAPLAPLPADAREELAVFARRALSGEVTAVTPATVSALSPALRRTNPEQLFVTIFRDRAPSIRFGSQRNGIVGATFAAMTKARSLPSFNFYNYGDAQNVAVLFERVSERQAIPAKRWYADLPFMDLGVHGIAVTHGERTGTLPPAEVFLSWLETRDAFIGKLSASLDLYPRQPKVSTLNTLLWDKDKTKVELLSFETFVSRGPSYRTVDLYRMNDLAVEPWKDVLAVARWMGDALVRRQTVDGRFFTRFDARSGRYSYAFYDIVGHGYAIMTLLDLAEVTGEKTYLDSASRAIGFLKKQFRMNPDRQAPFLYVVYDQKASLGASAMAIVALDRYASLTGAVLHNQDMKLLGKFILHQQYEDGSFLHYYRYDPKVPYYYKVSPSFPGQAVWALAVLERRFGEQSWRQVADKSVAYLINRREKEMHWTDVPADVWFAAALQELCVPFAEKTSLDYARRMAEQSIKQQKIKDTAPDLVGSFEGDPEGSVLGAAIRTRLLGEVMTFTANPPERREAAFETMRRAVAFIRLNELRPNNTFYLSEPEGAYGLVRDSSFDSDVSLETICHVTEALLWLDRLEKMRSTP